MFVDLMSALSVCPILGTFPPAPAASPTLDILTDKHVGLSVGSGSRGEAQCERLMCSWVFLHLLELWFPLKFSWS